jgi:hypothetical protein
MTFGERLGEARPACAAVELGASVEERKAAQAARENARTLLVKEDAAKGRFGAMLQKDMPLLVAQIGDEMLELLFGGWSEIEGG